MSEEKQKETLSCHILQQKPEINTEVINSFLEGHDPMKHIVSIELGYDEAKASVIFINDDGVKKIRMEDYKPFVWVKNSACLRMFEGDKGKLKMSLLRYGIAVKALYTCTADDPYPADRLRNGYKYLFYSTRRMSYGKFQNFFREAGVPINEKKKDNDNSVNDNEIMAVTPIEQFMIQTGKRLFKGYESYDELHRVTFDIETQGLNAKKHCIDQIGVRDNRGFEEIITIKGDTIEEKNRNEIKGIERFIQIIAQLKPDTMAGHNTENFDWNFIMTRCEVLGVSFEELTKKYLRFPIYKKSKPQNLKLGGEVETYYPTIIWGTNVLDSLHATRRAMATDSDFEYANLKYATKYLKLNKINRVYVPGDIITDIWNVTEEKYAFNNENGDWYEVSDEKPLKEDYEKVTGKYIVERYLKDDLWEADKVELKLNETNFLVSKIVPTGFTRCATMGTAGIWKLIILAWCFEHDLAIPAQGENRRFTGGLSRLLKTGYEKTIIKGDYDSLYPSITLTWWIKSPLDITNVLLYILEYILTQREFYKGKKKDADKKSISLKAKIDVLIGNDEEKAKLEAELQKWESEYAVNDKKQSQLKVLQNSYFGSSGNAKLFPMGVMDCAEKTTCIGRMSLRLMIHYFKSLGYTPIVGDTDGFDYAVPEKLRYTKEHPYIGQGKNFKVKKGVEYTGVEADLAEFNDEYMNSEKCSDKGIMHMHCGLDEKCKASVNFRRKVYACWMEDGSLKKVGNSIKSRKMAGFLQKFMNSACETLLKGEGYKFLQDYYNYIDDIYNYRIPVKDIASKGKFKKSVAEYKADCNTLTKAGSKKSRQAWYELAIKDGLEMDMGDTLYYINTGKKKTESDVKRITHQFMYDKDGKEVEITNKIITSILKEKMDAEGNITFENGDKKKYSEFTASDKKHFIKPLITREEDEVILNCKRVPLDILQTDKDVLCSDVPDIEYNVEKYINQFNSRIKTMLVCFSPDIRNEILIANPDDRKEWTREQSQLISGCPLKESDQDTYEALMTPEDKEIDFWIRSGERPPFVDDIGMPWEELVEKYKREKKERETEEYKIENEKYLNALLNLNGNDVLEFEEEGTIPSSISSIMELNSADMKLYFKKIPNALPSTGGNVFDDIVLPENDE
jgi:DNA polymerase elongation subunit (family B)